MIDHRAVEHALVAPCSEDNKFNLSMSFGVRRRLSMTVTRAAPSVATAWQRFPSARGASARAREGDGLVARFVPEISMGFFGGIMLPVWTQLRPRPRPGGITPHGVPDWWHVPDIAAFPDRADLRAKRPTRGGAGESPFSSSATGPVRHPHALLRRHRPGSPPERYHRDSAATDERTEGLGSPFEQAPALIRSGSPRSPAFDS